ncbi:hypothetical protein [Hungatella effluvii]|uniref:hypothetical protein n=1 Tax=Hungatella effluvii TaxID=1096246 RepID=UPI0022E6994A|nr:hypothetical protein [Hungatella effluvii]
MAKKREKNKAKNRRFCPRFFVPSTDAGWDLNDICGNFKASQWKIGWPFYVIQMKLDDEFPVVRNGSKQHHNERKRYMEVKNGSRV